jgi:hypothetical protein
MFKHKHKMTTIAMKIKELMANMPDTLNTKKEIDDYYKEAMKKSVVSKSNKKDASDADKPKKELNGYQLFMKEKIKVVKEENPSLTGPEVFSKIAELWKKQKEEAVSGAATSVPVVAAVAEAEVAVVAAEVAEVAVAEVAPVETVVKVEDEKTEVKKKKK